MRLPAAFLTIVCFSAADPGAIAGEADVVDVSAQRTLENTYTFSVTVTHADTGWDHYADRWQVLGSDGAVLGERILLHPHQTEQPFTRELSGVVIPEGIDEVTIRAGDKIHGFGGAEATLELTDAVGQ
jgi:hypothetical protein